MVEGTHYGCIQWSQRHWYANLKWSGLLNHVLVHKSKDFLLSLMEMLWPILLHCQFPKRYQHHTERITWNSHGEWSLTMGWAALCGCLSLFMATGGARWCVQTGHLTFDRPESHLSPIWLLSQLYCSGPIQEKTAPNEPTCHCSRCSSTSCLFSAAWVEFGVHLDSRWPPSSFEEHSAVYSSLSLVAFTGTGLVSRWSGPVLCPCKQPCCTHLSWGFPPLQHALTHTNTQLHQFQQKLNRGKIKIISSSSVPPR